MPPSGADHYTRPATLSVTVRSDLGGVARLTRLAEEFCSANGLAPALAGQLSLVYEELLTNVIAHGHDGAGDGHIDVHLSLSNGRLTTEIADDGKPFDPATAPQPDLAAPLEQRAVGGVGWHLIKTVMDSVDYRRERNRNIVTMSKVVA